MKIVVVTDAWTPQINGVVISLTRTIKELERLGHRVQVIEPGQFNNVPCPTYSEIRLALSPGARWHGCWTKRRQRRYISPRKDRWG